MIIEDHLTQDQRIRVECLTQAILTLMHNPRKSSEDIIRVSKKYEDYILNREPATIKQGSKGNA